MAQTTKDPSQRQDFATAPGAERDPYVVGHGLEVALPAPTGPMEQDEEWVVVKVDGQWKQIRLHDYGDVYAVPGLYERWIYDIFRCQSPQAIRRLLAHQLRVGDIDPATLKVLDLGAGNGCVADELRDMGVNEFVGLDLVPEARTSAERDRPGLYKDYIIGDLLNLPDEEQKRLDGHSFNCLTCVAALGFGDIPPEVFAEAYNRVDDGGWIAFTIKDAFLDEDDPSGFSRLIRRMMREGVMEVAARERYAHRQSTNGYPLFYVAFIGRKKSDVTDELLKDV